MNLPYPGTLTDEEFKKAVYGTTPKKTTTQTTPAKTVQSTPVTPVKTGGVSGTDNVNAALAEIFGGSPQPYQPSPQELDAQRMAQATPQKYEGARDIANYTGMMGADEDYSGMMTEDFPSYDYMMRYGIPTEAWRQSPLDQWKLKKYGEMEALFNAMNAASGAGMDFQAPELMGDLYNQYGPSDVRGLWDQLRTALLSASPESQMQMRHAYTGEGGFGVSSFDDLIRGLYGSTYGAPMADYMVGQRPSAYGSWLTDPTYGANQGQTFFQRLMGNYGLR